MEDFGKWFFGESSNLTGSCLSRAAAFFAEGQGMRFRMELQILALHRRETRRDALRFLVAHQEYHPKLGPMLWDTCNTVFVLLQEVFSAYPMLKVQSVTMAAAERASNALILIKCAASHRDAKRLLVNAKIQEYLYAILRTTPRDETHDRLSLRSLEVINKLLEEGDEETVLVLAEARLVLYCLRAILASPISTKQVAALVLQRLLMNESGMKCCCTPICQFIMIARALTFTVEERSIVLSRQLLRHIAACFLCLSRHPRNILKIFLPPYHLRALEVLHDCLPMRLGDPYISNLIQAEPLAWEILREAAANLGGGRGHRHVDPRVPRFGPIGKPPGTWVN